MKKKTPRRRIDVNVEELDRIIDGAKSAPLSESDSQKLKTALHALAERLLPRPKTEKTSSVFSEESGTPETDRKPKEPAAGHGRNSADAYRGAEKIKVAHPKLVHGDRCPDCARGNVYTQKEPRTVVRIVGQAPLAATVYELERLRCNACGQVFTAEEAGRRGHGKVRRNGGVDDRAAQVWQRRAFPPVGADGGTARHSDAGDHAMGAGRGNRRSDPAGAR